MKFLYLTDTHIRGINPRNRLGNYYQDIMIKFQEIISIAKKEKVDYIIHGGDLFSTSLVSNIIVDEVIDMIEKAKITMYMVWGNHDEIGHNVETSNSTSLAHIFRRSKYIKQLDILEGDNYIIKGFHYYHNIEEEIKKNGLKYDSNKLKIGILHAFVTPKAFLPSVIHIKIDDIDTNFDFIFLGHNHSDLEVIQKDKTIYLSTGAISRGTIMESDINRTPKIIIFNTDNREYKFINLTSAKSIEEIFDIKKINERKQFDDNIEDFIKELTNDTELLTLDIKGNLELIAKEKDIDREIIDDCLKRIENCIVG